MLRSLCHVSRPTSKLCLDKDIVLGNECKRVVEGEEKEKPTYRQPVGLQIKQ